jgi:hypothetical protein
MHRGNSSRIGIALAFAAVCVLTAACAGKINQENYGKVAVGMSQPDVEAILGPGTEQASTSVAMPAMPNMPNVPGAPAASATPAPSNLTTKVLVWRTGGKMITVTMVNDKVFSKAQVGL